MHTRSPEIFTSQIIRQTQYVVVTKHSLLFTQVQASFPKSVASSNGKIKSPLRNIDTLLQNIDWEFLDAPLDGVV